VKDSSLLDIALIATRFKIEQKGLDMVKKIKIKQKAAEKSKLNWKVIIAIFGVLALIALIFMMIGQAGLKSGR
jgi:hypothetical protein